MTRGITIAAMISGTAFEAITHWWVAPFFARVFG